MEYTALTLLRKVAPRMIVVVEVHDLLAGSAHEQRASLNLLKFLSNPLKCAIVVLGTRDALAAMQTDAQIASRFPGFEFAAMAGERRLPWFSGWVRATVAVATGVADLCKPRDGQRHHERHGRRHRPHQRFVVPRSGSGDPIEEGMHHA